MNMVAISGFFLGLTCLFLGVLLLKYGTNKVHLTFALQNLCISGWGFGSAVAAIAKSPDMSLLWWKIGHISAFFLAVLLLHHVLLLNKMSGLFPSIL